MNEERTSKRLSIRHIRAFVAVAKHRSLTRAAESLFVTQSALSLTIQHLEDDLGVSLFDRSTRRLDLTQAGEEFLPSAERLLQDFDSSIREMRALGKRERGKVGVAAVPSVMALLLPEAVAAYIDAFPNIDIYLREDNSEAVQQRIVDGDVDFGICSPWEPDAELVFEPLFEDCFGVVFAPHHPLATGDGELSWEEVSGYRIVGFSSDLGMQPVEPYAGAQPGSARAALPGVEYVDDRDAARTRRRRVDHVGARGPARAARPPEHAAPVEAGAHAHGWHRAAAGEVALAGGGDPPAAHPRDGAATRPLPGRARAGRSRA
ncbi:regulatory helix-turn-helix LysR family protein [Paraburkholderia sp. BL8N3]|nr:LysR family transcriptional regulator [Paraburkholderia sp. BL8N3]TCK35062.1 regulatory helix-turn-helix LysR family protein [Paraburkholderia sp. BL8N3]